MLVGGVLAGVFVGLTAVELSPAAAKAAMLFLILGGGVGLFVAIRQASRLATSYERRWLERLPFPLDLPGYLETLGVRRKSGRPVVTLRFVGALSEEQRDSISTAMDGLTATPLYRNVVDSDTEVEWSGTDLRITGPRVSTHTSRSGESTESYGNTHVHKWVRRFLTKGALPLHDRFELDSVSISVREY